jgi:hypothetical protein
VVNIEKQSKTNITQTPNTHLNDDKKMGDDIICKYCNKIFSHKNSKWRHEKICKLKNDEDKNIIINKQKHDIEILKLKLELEKEKKNNDKSFKAINKMLKNRALNKVNVENSNLNNSCNTNSNNTTNNIQINNTIQICGFGKEEILEYLLKKDKKKILNAKNLCLEKLVEITNCGNYNQFKNIVITNLKDNYVYKFDQNKGYFVISTKDETITDLVSERTVIIEEIYDEFYDKLDNSTKKCVEEFLEKMQNESEPFIDLDNKKHDNYKKYKIEKIKILLYNYQDKITKDIELSIRI